MRTIWQTNAPRFLLLGALAAGYLAIYLALYRDLGTSIAFLVSLPTAVAAWMFGLRIGLLAAALGSGVNLLLIAATNPASLSNPAGQISLFFGGIIIIFFTVALGYIHDLSVRLRAELVHREAVQRAERQRNAELEGVYSASLQLNSSLELKPVLTTILNQVAMLLHALNVHIFLYDGERLHFGATLLGGAQQEKPFSEPRQHGLTYTVARTGRRIIVSDVASAPLFKDRQWDGSIAGFPLSIGDRTYGVMNVAFAAAHEFTDSELRIVELLAAQAAVAIRNASDYESTRHHAVELEHRVAERTAELRRAKENAEVLLNNSFDVILLLNPDGIIRQTNPAFDRVFGVAQDGDGAHSFVELFHEAAIVEETLKVVAAERSVKRLVATVRRSGAEFPAELVFAPLESGDSGVEIICNLRDVSERQHAELRQQALVLGLRKVLAVTYELIASPDVDTLWKRAIECARDQLGVERCSIFIERGDHMYGTYGTSLKRETTDEHHTSFFKGPRRSWERLEHVFTLDTPTWEVEYTMQQEWDGTTMVDLSDGWVAVTPIHSAYRFIGVFYNDTAISRTPLDEIQQEILAIYCSMLGSLYEHKRVEDEVRRALERERELSELKTRFTSMISHELRTPLASIQLASDLLKGYNDRLTDEARDQYLGKIQAQVRHLTSLLEDVLTYTKSEQVGLQLQPKATDLQALCVDLCAELRVTHPSHQLVFEVAPAAENWTVLVDPKLMRQAVMNLLTNAIKYSAEGTTVTLALDREERDAVIGVADQGIGISETDMPHIYEVFYRGKNVSTIAGTGLGLPLVRQIAEAHHGFVYCESKLGVGTTFTLRVPVFA